MKKYLSLLSACLIFITVFTACSSHSHTADENWYVDLENHRSICAECGEQIKTEPHEFDEEGCCAVCGATLFDFGDGTYSIMSYDSQGGINFDGYYDGDGNLLSSRRYVNEYYEDGYVKSISTYEYDPLIYGDSEIMTGKDRYLVCENSEYGEAYLDESTAYNADGSGYTTKFAENGDIITYTEFDAEGNSTSSSRYEYEYDENGERLYMAVYTDDKLDYEEFSVAVPNSSSAITKQILYNADGLVLSLYEYDYEFDSEGNTLRHTAYLNGVIDWENIYEYSDGCTYLAIETDYDENGELISEIHYDADGNVTD